VATLDLTIPNIVEVTLWVDRRCVYFLTRTSSVLPINLNSHRVVDIWEGTIFLPMLIMLLSSWAVYWQIRVSDLHPRYQISVLLRALGNILQLVPRVDDAYQVNAFRRYWGYVTCAKHLTSFVLDHYCSHPDQPIFLDKKTQKRKEATCWNVPPSH